MTNFESYVTGLPADELIKLAEDMRQGITSTVANIVAPMLEKFAEEMKNTDKPTQASAEPEPKAEEVPPQVEKTIQGETDENDLKGGNAGIDQKALKMALKEALYSGDVNSLGTIIQTLNQQFGSEMATNTINLARTIMQEGLNSQDPASHLTPEQVAVFAKAFESFDNAMGNAPTSAE